MANKLRNSVVVITGASSGIGTAFARQLAADGASLVITARRQERLEALAQELRATYGVEVDVVVSDLSRPDGAATLFAATEEAGRPVDILINNAGFGSRSHLLDLPWERTAQELQLNVVSLTELARR